jgi:hypothetical protein
MSKSTPQKASVDVRLTHPRADGLTHLHLLRGANRNHERELRFQSGWGDLNSRPLVPQTSALTKLRYSPLLRMTDRIVTRCATFAPWGR